MATLNNIDFFLNALDTSLNVLKAEINAYDTSNVDHQIKRALCRLKVDASSCRNIFQFATNAADLTDVSAEDMYFFVDASGFKNLSSNNTSENVSGESGTQAQELFKNIGNAYVHGVANDAINHAKNTKGVDYTPDNKGMIKDLFRDLAHQMFNTQYGVDLFANETDLCNNVFNTTSALFKDATDNSPSAAGSIWKTLNDASGKSIDWEYSNKKKNIGRILFEAIVAGDPDRLMDLSTNEYVSTSSMDVSLNTPGSGSNSQQSDEEMRMYKMPLKAGDTIIFHLRYKFHSDQKKVLLSSATDNYDDRVYEVKLILQ